MIYQKLIKTLCVGLFIFTSSLSQAQEHVLKIGTLIFNPPFETSDAKRNVYSGFEIDIMLTICQRLKLSCQFVPVPTVNDIFMGLASRQFDIAVGGIIVLKGDTEHLYSLPYLPSGIQFFANKNSKLTRLNDIVLSHLGTTDDPLIRTLVTENYAKKYPLNVFASPQAGIEALTSGSIDAFVMQTPTTKYWLANTSDAFKAVGHPIPIGLGNGVVGLPESDVAELIGQINIAILEMQHDGTYVQIYNRYDLQ